MCAWSTIYISVVVSLVPRGCKANCSPGALVGLFGDCYKVNFVAEYWEKAATICVESGGNLASINSSADHMLLSGFTKDSVDDVANAFWLGAFFDHHEWKWKWKDGSVFQLHELGSR